MSSDAHTPSERVVLQNVWKMYDRRYGSNRFRKLLSAMAGRHPERYEFWALKDVSFTLREGSSLGIIGPNGSGKTTMLRILSGISQINRGHVHVRGTVSALIALGAGFHPELTGRENIYLNGSILGLKRSEIREYFDDIVDFADIGDYIDSPVKRYSSGMFVRLGFAVAAQIRPDILLVDEVLAVGDASFQMRCHERIRQLRDNGTIIILVSHNLWAIRQACQEALYLHHGEVRASGDVVSVIAAYNRAIQEENAERRRALPEQASGPDAAYSDCVCDIEFISPETGEQVAEIPLGAPVVLRLYYRADTPIEHPTIVITATGQDGVCTSVLRSRKSDWEVDRLVGSGHIDLTLESLRFSPGNYAFQMLIKDPGDLTALVASRFRDFFVHPPHTDWCYEACHYIPEARWSEPVTHSNPRGPIAREDAERNGDPAPIE